MNDDTNSNAPADSSSAIPDDAGAGAEQTAASTDYARPVRDVTLALRHLHRELVEVVKQGYEAEHGAVGGPGNLLHLLMSDASFAWMRTMSELMVDIDELVDSRDVRAADAAAVRREVESLVAPAAGAEPSDFARKYIEVIQGAPFLATSHASMRAALAALPVEAGGDSARAEWVARGEAARRARLRK